MKVLFVASSNKGFINPTVMFQGDAIKKEGVSVVYFGIAGKGYLGYLSNIVPLKKIIKKEKPDVIHAHYAFCGVVTGFASPGIPIVVSLMGSDTKLGLLRRVLFILLPSLMWDTIIVKSSSMKKVLGLGKALVVPNGVDLEEVKPHVTEDSGSGSKVVLFGSDPERPSKNFLLANKAYSIVKEKINDSYLKIVFGKPHHELIKEINSAKVLLVTSLWEGSPNIVKESMACNCPVVSTDVGDVKWLFGDEPGYYLTTYDPMDVANKITSALKYSDKYGKTNGRQRIINLGLDSTAIARKILEVYRKVLES